MIIVTMLVIAATYIYLISHNRPVLPVWAGNGYGFIVYIIVLQMITYIVTRFWARKMNDYRLYNSRYGMLTKWHWHAFAVVCIGLLSLFIMDIPLFRNETLFQAVKDNDILTVREMLDRGADPNYRNKYNESTIFETFSHGSPGILKLLLEHGAKWNTKDDNGCESALTYTLESGKDADTALLLKYGAKPDFLEQSDVETNYNRYLQRQAELPNKQ